MSDDFFEECREQSQIKAEIVSEYFPAWAKIILSQRSVRKIGYIDLFAGPGRYDDGTPSTPLLVLEQAIAIDSIRRSVSSVFCDMRQQHVEKLGQEIANLPNVATLTYAPEILPVEVGQNVVSTLNERRLIPSLVFLDPCGYKGLSLDLINAVLKHWACECIVFFNYNRINAGIANECVEEHIDRLFGQKRADALRLELIGKTPSERERIILNRFIEALTAGYAHYVQTFRFRNKTGTRTSHYLIFVTKHLLGYKVMKDIMGARSSTAPQGVHSFEFNPAAVGQLQFFDTPLDELKDMLLIEFAGQSLTVEEIVQKHYVGRRYLWKNYKQALLDLLSAGQISVDNQKRKNSMADHVVVHFPMRKT